MTRALVVGAGVGGLAAALRLAQLGWSVRVLEARASAGGLAGGFELDGLSFDAGPYVLLDRPGLEWAFAELGLDLASELRLTRLDLVYQVDVGEGALVRLYADRERTAAEMEACWPGSGRRYLEHVGRMQRVYARLAPLQRVARPRALDLVRVGAWREAPFLLRSLESVLRAAELPAPVCTAIAIWTHVAGQTPALAPSPMAMIPALIHAQGAFVPEGGLGAVPRALERALARAGVAIEHGRRVRRIVVRDGRAQGVETTDGERMDAEVVVSNAHGVGTHLELVEGLPISAKRALSRLDLQSPGVCAYLRVRAPARPPYLQFRLPRASGESPRLLVQPGAVDAGLASDGALPARLLSPMPHALAERMDVAEQRAHLERLLAEPWWREIVGDAEVLALRVPRDWGAQYHLHRDSMNPVMSARFMRQGRLAHRSPWVRGLYLAGSSTHPGQWVSFCAISGVLAADLAHADAR